MKVFIFVILYFTPCFSSATSPDCGRVMSNLQNPYLMANLRSDKSTQVYMSLLRHLVKEKNALSSKALELMASQKSLPNPMDFVSDSLRGEDRYSFGKAFSTLGEVNWLAIQNKVRDLLQEKSVSEIHREGSRETTSYVFAPILLNKSIPLPHHNFEGGFQDKNGSLFLYGGHKSQGNGADPGRKFYVYDVAGKTNSFGVTRTGWGQFSFFETRGGKVYILGEEKTDLTVSVLGSQVARTIPNPSFINISPKELQPTKAYAFENSKGEIEIVRAFYAPFKAVSDVFFSQENLTTGIKSPIQTLPLGGYNIQMLSDDSLVAVGAGNDTSSSDIIVKEINRTNREISRIKKPFGLARQPHSRVIETKSGRRFLAALGDELSSYIFDMTTGESFDLGHIFKTDPEFLAFEESDSGELVLLATDMQPIMPNDIRTVKRISVNFHEKTLAIEELPYSSKNTRELLRLKDDQLLYLHWSPGREGETLLNILNVTTGLTHQLTFPFRKFRLFTAEDESGRLISYFLYENNLSAVQIYGPLENDQSESI